MGISVAEARAKRATDNLPMVAATLAAAIIRNEQTTDPLQAVQIYRNVIAELRRKEE